MVIVDKGKHMFMPHLSILMCTFRILLRWHDSGGIGIEGWQWYDRGATVVQQWCNSGAPTGPFQMHSCSVELDLSSSEHP